MLNCALIGPGRMGINYAKVIQQNPYANLIAICGNTQITTEKNARQFNVPLYFNNKWDEMLEKHPEINTVIISSSEWAHLAPFEFSVLKEKNIIIEKPVVAQETEYRKILELIEAYKQITILACHTCRFDFRYVQAKKQIEQGEIGEVAYIYCRRNASVKTAERVMGKISKSYWLSVHDIDLMRWYTNSEVKEVYAVQSEKKGKGNFLIVNLLFANGTRGVIENVWVGDDVNASEATRSDIEGTKGKIEISCSSSLKQSSESTVEFDEWDMVDVHGEYHGSTPSMINHFVDVILNKKTAVITIHDALQAVRVCVAIDQSLKTKKVIEL
jgi:myo-inositol 2-dehydrogenase/D-chiro-inositol 1-dehydrogenase